MSNNVLIFIENQNSGDFLQPDSSSERGKNALFFQDLLQHMNYRTLTAHTHEQACLLADRHKDQLAMAVIGIDGISPTNSDAKGRAFMRALQDRTQFPHFNGSIMAVTADVMRMGDIILPEPSDKFALVELPANMNDLNRTIGRLTKTIILNALAKPKRDNSGLITRKIVPSGPVIK